MFDNLTTLRQVEAARTALYRREAAGEVVSEDVWCALGDAAYRVMGGDGNLLDSLAKF